MVSADLNHSLNLESNVLELILQWNLFETVIWVYHKALFWDCCFFVYILMSFQIVVKTFVARYMLKM